MDRVAHTREVRELLEGTCPVPSVRPRKELTRYLSSIRSTTVKRTPKSYSQAVKLPTRDKWLEAYRKEVHNNETVGDIKPVLQDPGMKVYLLTEIFTIKTDGITEQEKFKVRICGRGDLVDVHTPVYAPVVNHMTVRLVLTIAHNLRWIIRQLDVSGANLYGTLEEVVLLYLPQGHSYRSKPERYVWRCASSLYGLPQSGRCWFKELSSTLTSLGYKKLVSTDCLFMKRRGEDRIIIAVYVDDLLFVSPSRKLITQFEHEMQSKYNVRIGDLTHTYVGYEVNYSGKDMLLTQTNRITQLAADFQQLESRRETNPVPAGFRPMAELPVLSDTTLYRYPYRPYRQYCNSNTVI